MSRTKIPKMVDSKTISEQFCISRQTLMAQVKAGILRPGVHYIVVSQPNAKNATYRWNPEALWELWATDPAQRH